MTDTVHSLLGISLLDYMHGELDKQSAAPKVTSKYNHTVSKMHT